MDQLEFERLINKYLDGTASPEERLQVDLWYEELSGNQKLTDADDFEQLSAELREGTMKRAGIIRERKEKTRWA